MKKILIVTGILFLHTICLQSQTVSIAQSPEQVGISSKKLQKIDKEMSAWVDKGWMNGGAALIIRNGKIVYHKALGYNDLDTKALLKKDDIFRIASQTKAITSVAIMLLYEDGKLLLDDPVSKYIPSFKKQTVLDKFNEADTTYTTVPAVKEITIRELLTHTSGLGYATIGSKEANSIYAKNKISSGLEQGNTSLLDAISRLGTLPLMHQPGAKFTYGLNTDVLGCLVEVISGMNLEQFFKTRIFEPLGMKDTHFNLPSEKTSRLVNLYLEEKDGSLHKATSGILNTTAGPEYPTLQHSYFSGGAGLSSTVLDYGIFLQMLLNNGKYNGNQLLSRNAVRLMTSNQIGDINLGADKFGLGFQVISEKGAARTMAQEGTFSWGGAFATSYWADPKEKMVLVFYRQLLGGTHGDVVEKFRALAYQSIID
ncbi:MAG: serine hydrolase domain-containing protein [Bacteroidota bacterium]